MKQQVKQKSSVISPVTLIILGVAIVGLIFLLLTGSDNDKNPIKPTSNTSDNPNIVTLTPEVSNNENVQNIAEDTTTDVSDDEELVNVYKNPFKTPQIVLNMLQKRNNSGTPQIPVPEVPKDPFGNNIAQPETKNAQDSKKDYALSWRGVIGTDNDQLAIIRNKGKTHFLRLGDRLMETNYTLSKMETNYILLQSPTDQVMLERIKGDKLK